MSLLPLLKTEGRRRPLSSPPVLGLGLLSSPPRNGREEGSGFRKSPELAAYSAADSPEKVKSPKQDQKS